MADYNDVHGIYLRVSNPEGGWESFQSTDPEFVRTVENLVNSLPEFDAYKGVITGEVRVVGFDADNHDMFTDVCAIPRG